MVQDGKHTAFWLDTWVGEAPLAVQFASLFSHALDKTASVHAVLSRGVRASLVPRLNATGGGTRIRLSLQLGLAIQALGVLN
jgi:hypothetical protein